MVKLAFILYDGVTTLDFAGMYDPLSRLRTMGFLPDLEYHVCALKDKIRSSEGLELVPDIVGGDLSSYDHILIPGGNGIEDLMNNRQFLEWITVRGDRPVVAAVCGGALLAGATGILRGRRATTHPNLKPFLARFAQEVTGERIVDEGMVITAGGVTAAIDLGLYLCEKIAGPGIREKIQVQMDYPYYPFP